MPFFVGNTEVLNTTYSVFHTFKGGIIKMNENRFRGKAIIPEDEILELDCGLVVERGDWIYGALVGSKEDPFIVGPIAEVDSEYIVFDFWVPVDPKTVCRHIWGEGENEIFEKDIVRDHILGHAGVVIVEDKYPEVALRHRRGWSFLRTDGELLGNIFDNPELLEV